MNTNNLNRCKPLLGTFVELSLAADVSDEKLLQLSDVAFSEIERVQSALSFHSQTSELTVFNRWALSGAQSEFSVSSDLRKVLALALQLNNETQGQYDVCVAPALIKAQYLPDHLPVPTGHGCLGGSSSITLVEQDVCVSQPLCIDLGGIAKGYAVDCAFSKIPADVRVIINAGGDLRMRDWREQSIDIRFADSTWAMRNVVMQGAALATSANYYREAIVDPNTARPVKRKGSVSIFASSAMLADALTKVAWLLPKKSTKLILKRFNASAITINRFGMIQAL